eukprot:2321673-Amphidinium_carterae.1
MSQAAGIGGFFSDVSQRIIESASSIDAHIDADTLVATGLRAPMSHSRAQNNPNESSKGKQLLLRSYPTPTCIRSQKEISELKDAR